MREGEARGRVRATLELDGRAFEVGLTPMGDRWNVDVDGEAFDVRLAPNGIGCQLTVGKRVLHIQLGERDARIDGAATPYRILAVTGAGAVGTKAASHTTHVRPPMNGKLERLAVAVGQTVAKGDVLFVLEAMKMQNEVRSPAAGRVAAIHLQAGATVEPKHVVLDIEPL